MKSQFAAFLFCTALPVLAQNDSVWLTTGEIVRDVAVTSWDVRALKYTKGGGNETVSSDKVAQVVLAKYKDQYRRGIDGRDPDFFLGSAGECVAAKNLLLAQFGYHAAARLWFDNGEAAKAVSALDELVKQCPDAGLLPEVYRMKFEYYMGRGQAGARDASAVAKKYIADANGNAWPAGLALEGEFFAAMAERVGGGEAKAFESRLREIVGRALGNFPQIANRANVQLGNSLRDSGKNEDARKIYQDIVDKEGVDENARAGAYIGLGSIRSAEGSPGAKEAYREAMLLFLRVRIEAKGSWDSLQAEALYGAMDAALKWGGEDSRTIAGRCKFLITTEYADTEWAGRAKGR